MAIEAFEKKVSIRFLNKENSYMGLKLRDLFR